ncbi:lysozyme [Pedobacter immunditicola]|uniref:lysozyme n=1 Tax=Pedobacter immunditicola TaxID=3133440 RepID=UPI00309D5A70
MQIDKIGRQLIYNEEGVVLNSYLCSAGIPTLGIGFTYYPSTGKKVKMGEKITRVECDQIFNQIIKTFEQAVNKAIKVALTQNQFNALVSLCFNIGVGAFTGSTLVKKINTQSHILDIEKWFLAWKNSGGKPILLNRRKREFKIYNT